MAHPYANRTKIESRSTRYLNEENVTDAMLLAAQEYADAEIDSRLGAKYEVPFEEPIPAKIVEDSADLAAYFLILDLLQNGMGDAPVEYANELYRRAQESLKFLTDSSDAGASLPDEVTPDTPPTNLGRSVYAQAGRTGILANFDGIHRPTV